MKNRFFQYLNKRKNIKNMIGEINNISLLNELEKFESISFSLDGVLIDEYNGELNPIKNDIQNICKTLLNKGKKVFIITKRFDSGYTKYDKELRDENILGYDFAKLIGVDIVFTNRNTYFAYLSNNSKHCHIDSSAFEIMQIKNNKPNITTININDIKNEHVNG